MSKEINTRRLKVDFGKYKGKFWTQVPINYIRWLLNKENLINVPRDVAMAEVKRRGTLLSKSVEVSAHAIDRASQLMLDDYLAEKNNFGFYTWVQIRATLAFQEGKRLREDRFEYKGYSWVFDFGVIFPILTTVMKR